MLSWLCVVWCGVVWCVLFGEGLESARRIRQWEAESGAPAVPIVAATGQEADGGVAEACLASGGQRWLARHDAADAVESMASASASACVWLGVQV